MLMLRYIIFIVFTLCVDVVFMLYVMFILHDVLLCFMLFYVLCVFTKGYVYYYSHIKRMKMYSL